MRDLAQRLLETFLQVVPQAFRAAADIAPGRGEGLIDTIDCALGHLAPERGLAAIDLVFVAELGQGVLIERRILWVASNSRIERFLLRSEILQQLDLRVQAINDTLNLTGLLQRLVGVKLCFGLVQQQLVFLAANLNVSPGQRNRHRLLNVERFESILALQCGSGLSQGLRGFRAHARDGLCNVQAILGIGLLANCGGYCIVSISTQFQRFLLDFLLDAQLADVISPGEICVSHVI